VNEFEFLGFAVAPCSGLLECLDAAGIDGCLDVPTAAPAEAAQSIVPMQ